MPASAERAIQATGCNFLVYLKCVKKKMAAATAMQGQLAENEKLPEKGDVMEMSDRQMTAQPAAAMSPVEAGRRP